MPVWTELLADLETPVAAYVKLVGDGPGFLLESVEHGRALGAVLVRRPRSVGDARAARRRRRTRRRAARRHPDRRGDARRARGAARAATPARRSTTCRRCTAASWATSATTSIREVERLPDVPPDDRRLSRRGDVGDRLAGRVRPLAPAGLPDRERADARARRGAARRGLRRRDRTGRAGRGRSRRAAAVRAGRAAVGRRRAAGRCAVVDARRAVPAGRRGGQGAHPRRRHLPGRAGAALRPRARRRSVRRLPRAASGEPVARTCTSCVTPS